MKVSAKEVLLTYLHCIESQCFHNIVSFKKRKPRPSLVTQKCSDFSYLIKFIKRTNRSIENRNSYLSNHSITWSSLSKNDIEVFHLYSKNLHI